MKQNHVSFHDGFQQNGTSKQFSNGTNLNIKSNTRNLIRKHTHNSLNKYRKLEIGKFEKPTHKKNEMSLKSTSNSHLNILPLMLNIRFFVNF